MPNLHRISFSSSYLNYDETRLRNHELYHIGLCWRTVEAYMSIELRYQNESRSRCLKLLDLSKIYHWGPPYRLVTHDAKTEIFRVSFHPITCCHQLYEMIKYCIRTTRVRLVAITECWKLSSLMQIDIQTPYPLLGLMHKQSWMNWTTVSWKITIT